MPNYTRFIAHIEQNMYDETKLFLEQNLWRKLSTYCIPVHKYTFPISSASFKMVR